MLTLARAALLVGFATTVLVAGERARAATPAPASPVGACGDGLLAADETCASCSADCAVSTRKVTTRRRITVDLTPQEGYDAVGAVTLLIGYRKGVLSLPGEKAAPAAKARVTPRQATAQVFANDLGYALRVVVSSQAGLPAGPLLDLDLDVCAGAPVAQIGDLSCRVESCAHGGGKLRGCECRVSLP
ncbi:MAG: hypothetical protein U0802_14965 [Candidatus Binatia bacterium]